MALSYEPINRNTDVTNTKTMLHEVIPLTGTIISGTYGTWPDEGNIKNFTHGMFQSTYDYPYLSSSSNHIFDITIGYDELSPLSSSTSVQNSKKMAIYNQFSQLLLGYNQDDGKVEIFESDLDITAWVRLVGNPLRCHFGPGRYPNPARYISLDRRYRRRPIRGRRVRRAI